MSIQVKRRREAASFLSTFTGAQAELIVDTTNNRVQVHDGVTAGGWPAAKLSEVLTNARTAVADAAYSALASDRLIAFTALTASRTVTLCAASAYPTGTSLRILDETGACSPSNTIIVNRAGSDTIDGGLNFVLNGAYGALVIESNGLNKWTVLSPVPNASCALLGVGAAPDPSNPLSVYGTTALFNSAGNFSLTVNKAAAGDTASFIFEDGFSGRAQIGLCGDDNFHFKVSSNGSTWNTGLLIDAATGALTPGNARTAVSDAAYGPLATDRLVAYTALTAARVVSLPAASAFPAGVTLTIADESGACSATNTITIGRAGSDTINGAASATINAAYGYLALESNGSNAWTVIDCAPGAAAQPSALATVAQGAFGSNIQFGVLETLVALSGASTTAPTGIPANCIVFSVAARVVAAVTGAPSYGVGVSGSPTQFGGSLGVAYGSTNFGMIGPEPFYSATPLVITATSGSFTGGQVRLAIHYMLMGGPTS